MTVYLEGTMRLGLFSIILASLLVVVALVVPLPYGPRELVGGQASLVLGGADRCLRLTYADQQDERYMPGIVRLRSDTMSRGSAWLRADGGPMKGRDYDTAWWRTAGRDSIDVAWHHSPILRIPTLRGDSSEGVRGRVIPAGVAPLIEHTYFRERQLTAWPIACGKVVGPS